MQELYQLLLLYKQWMNTLHKLCESLDGNLDGSAQDDLEIQLTLLVL